jgi:ATP-dependent exoDNAse (exonuclease V) beta subunit
VDLATISGFKGLETPIAILLNLSEYNLPLDNPIMSSLVYVACTRAKHMLYIMVQKDDPKRAAFEAALKTIKDTGGMVLEGSDANFEFVGSVSHYNPDRVGWLSVNDPAFEKSTIMFFPHDVKAAGLEGLKTGDNLRFRPRVEGHSTIATDLKPLKLELNQEEVRAAPVTREEGGVDGETVEISKSPENDGASQVEKPKPVKPARPRRKSARNLVKAAKKTQTDRPPVPDASSVTSQNCRPVLGLGKSADESRNDSLKSGE